MVRWGSEMSGREWKSWYAELPVFSTWPTPQALADALRINQTVKILDLSRNNFGDEGVKARPPPHLTKETGTSHTSLHIGLSAWRRKIVSVFDAQALADAFRINKTIEHARLGGNNFSNEGLKARALQQGHGWADEPSVPWCHIGLGFLQHVAVYVHFTWVLRVDLSTHSAARPWPRPWKLMKPSQWSILTSSRSHGCPEQDARHCGLGGSCSEVVGLKGTFLWVNHNHGRKPKATTCAETSVSVVLLSSHPETGNFFLQQ